MRIESPTKRNNALPEAHGLKAWTIDPTLATLAGTQANVHLGSVYLEAGTVISKLSVPVTVAGATVTHAQLGIYDANLNLVASSGDTAGDRTAFQATGWVEVSLTTPYIVPKDGLYYLASAFAATTLPTVLNFSQNQAVIGGALPGGVRRGIHAQAQGTLPATAVSQGTFSQFPLIVAR